MKRKNIFSLLILTLFLLSGCTEAAVNNQTIPVGIETSSEFTVENNGQRIQPGTDAVFYLKPEAGLTFRETNYAGDYAVALENGKIKLTLKNVCYPTRVAVQMTDTFVTVTYDPNGSGEQITIPYDTSLRLRPNTDNGRNLFAREGHTLVSWNTARDGGGNRIGLGSRVTVADSGLTLYAQWAKWSEAADFDWTVQNGTMTLTGYHGSEETVVIPASVNGKPVTHIAAGAFRNCRMREVILPPTLQVVEDRAFQSCTLEILTVFDNIEKIRDASFERCTMLKKLQINAVEKPYGTAYRRESCYADKVDLLIQAQGQRKIVFYGGCAVWYNLDGTQLQPLVEQGYMPVNMGINGTCSSVLQMQILGHFLEDGDILFHTPEISSSWQMMLDTELQIKDDDKLWIGLEYNYDLVTLVDVSTLPGLITTFCDYLAMKKEGTSYNTVFTDGEKVFMDAYGCVAFYRDETKEGSLPDDVVLDTGCIANRGMKRLQSFYDQYQAKGVRIYVSYACINMDAVPEEQLGNFDAVQNRFREAIEGMKGPVLISRMEDYTFVRSDFYDTNYHLLTGATKENTRRWLRDLQIQMERDGLWEAK